MIKIRLMGEREEIKTIIENISHINDVRILALSDFYVNRGGASLKQESRGHSKKEEHSKQTT